MSFNSNDMIHSGNYESFFLLYVDQELSDVQMKMVDEFLALHPELQPEFDLLMSTRLPAEHIAFDKESLMAEHMHPGSVAEDLLLFMDDELPAEKKNIIEFEIASNKDYGQQYQMLMRTKLDASEKIVFPYKESLYHRSERVVALRTWMRVAAAVLIVTISGVIYLQKSDRPGTSPIAVKNPVTKTIDATNHSPEQTVKVSDKNQKLQNDPEIASLKNDHEVASLKNDPVQYSVKSNENKKAIVLSPSDNNIAALQPNDVPTSDGNERTSALVSNVSVALQAKGFTETAAATFDPIMKETINNSPVTSLLTERNTNDMASNDKKGSVKGFLRKASRLIEKRTGFDPINENGELLIGVVAVKLK
jgi:hypothetical protein